MPWVVIGDGAAGDWVGAPTDFLFLITDDNEYLITDDNEYLIVENTASSWTPTGTPPSGNWIPIGA